MRTRPSSSVLAIVLVVAAAILILGRIGDPAATPAGEPTFGPETPTDGPSGPVVTSAPETLSLGDIGRMSVRGMDAPEITPVEQAPGALGFVDERAALDTAKAKWGRDGTPTPFLVTMTDPSSIGSIDPIENRPVWVVRYSDFTATSPRGVELHWGYVLIDAQTGAFIKSILSP